MSTRRPLAHTQKHVGANPTPATNFGIDNSRVIPGNDRYLRENDANATDINHLCRVLHQ
jgi:hypothetical protein